MGRFFLQFKALVKRNFLLKRRTPSQTVHEFLWPIYFILILAMVKTLSTRDVNTSALPDGPVQELPRSFESPPHILYAPNDPSTIVFANTVLRDEIARWMPSNISSASILLTPFPSLNAADDAYFDLSKTNAHLGVYGGLGINLTSGEFTVRTRQNALPGVEGRLGYGTPSTKKIKENEGNCRDGSIQCIPLGYRRNGFINLQSVIIAAYFQYLGQQLNISQEYPATITMQSMAKDSFIPDASFIRGFAAIYYVYAYSFFIQFLVINLVAEKEKKQKEWLRIMGMHDMAFWLSWTMLYFVLIVLISCIAVLFVYITTFLSATRSDLGIFLLILILYGSSIINLAFVFAPFFTQVKKAAPIASLSTLMISLLYFAVTLTATVDESGESHSAIPVPGQWVLCLFSPVAMALAVDKCLYLDISRGGLTWANSALGDLPLWGIIMMLFIDTILYFALALWLDNVVPGEYGQRRPLLFFLMPSYWRQKPRTQEEMDNLISIHERKRSKEQLANIEEMLPEWDEHKKLRISNLVKKYKTDGKTTNAVDGVSLDIYEGQITAILGHNGAGKTTMLNILTGLTPSSDGDASIYGLQVSDSSDMRHIRSMMGVCPQQNVLFDVLSVSEHFEFFGAIKGLEPAETERQAARLISEVGLTEQADTYSRDLSGGQKRKLCVGLALLGDPKLVFLDEPSAGMDPNARRHLWNLLRENKKGRIIVLITHFMDEADILADRKAILTKGQLKCCGSSLYLKTKFGIGYHLSLSVNPPSFKKEEVDKLITSTVENSEFDRAHGMEVSYTLPYLQVSRFSDLFAKLEAPAGSGSTVAQELGISTFGISMTTLEEVFLKLEEEEEGMGDNDDEPANKRLSVIRTLSNRSSNVTQSPQGSPSKHVPNGNGSAAERSVNNSNSVDGDSEDESTPKLSEALKLSRDQLVGSEKELWHQKVRTLLGLRTLLIFRHKPALFLRLIMPVILIFGALCLVKFSPPSNDQSSLPPLALIPGPAFNNEVEPVAVVNATGGPLSSWESANVSTDGQVIWLPDGTDYVEKFKKQLKSELPQYAFQVDGFDPSNIGDSNVTMVYNDLWVHSLPVAIDRLSSILLQVATGGQYDKVVTTSLPWSPVTSSPGWNGAVFGFAMMIGFAIMFVATSVAGDVVKDRETKAKSQLRLAGVSFKLYWGTTMLVDYLQINTVLILVIILVLAFGISALAASGPMLCLIIYFILYVPLFMLIAYTISYGFDKFETVNASLPTIFSMANVLPYLCVSILSAIPNLMQTAKTLHLVFTFTNPLYTASGIFFWLTFISLEETVMQGTPTPTIPLERYLEWDSLIVPMFIPPLYFIPFFALLMMIVDVLKEGGSIRDIFCKRSAEFKANEQTMEDEDDDVKRERRMVEAGEYEASPAYDGDDDDKSPVLRISEVQKSFPRRVTKKNKKKGSSDSKVKLAVKNVTFQVSPGEVFGLLGPNGAGKSTLLNMLTAEMGPSAGKIQVCGETVQSNQAKVLRYIGYCPQFDALWESIKLSEHIEIYCKLQGIKPREVDKLTRFYINALRLQDHKNKISKNLSGGTKRKLSFVISLLGVPRVILLDEPSTGMDPQSKRVFWDTISSSFDGTDKGAILTTHYMEEADALCSRIGIMVNGSLECLGTSQHLKNKFGNGYLLEAKVQTGAASSSDNAETSATNALSKMNKYETYIRSEFPGASVVERFGERASFKIPNSAVTSLSMAFAALEKGKTMFGISEYNFSQSTLEQIFLEFARQQLDDVQEEDNDDGSSTLSSGKGRLQRVLSIDRTRADLGRTGEASSSGAQNTDAQADDKVNYAYDQEKMNGLSPPLRQPEDVGGDVNQTSHQQPLIGQQQTHSHSQVGQTHTDIGRENSEVGRDKSEIGQEKSEVGQENSVVGKHPFVGQNQAFENDDELDMGQSDLQLGQAETGQGRSQGQAFSGDNPSFTADEDHATKL